MSEVKNYKPEEIEAKWQRKWQEENLYKVPELTKKKYYVLDMFPYPSGEGLHVGHPKGYIATDVFARLKMLQGYDVLHPMGWDAFGLPAENYAIKNKVHPSVAVKKNVARYKEQLKMFGFTYDWDREIDTTDPEYYKWTQWIFLKLLEKGLAFESNEPVNWCPVDKTVLANEDLENGKCERCGSDIIQLPLRQWVLKMTAYADRLLYDLDSDELNWEESIKEQQRNWIGRSEGATVKFKVASSVIPAKAGIQSSETNRMDPRLREDDSFLEVFTTRVDTIFGCTYCVVAPEHPLLKNQESRIKNQEEIASYIEQANKKTILERTELQKEKTGVKIDGIIAINPFNGEEVPMFVGDYVLGSYGTGAVMAVPAHDERDFEFAKKYDLPIKQSIDPAKGYVVAIKKSLSDTFYKSVETFAQIQEKDGIVKIITENVDKVFELATGQFIGSPWYMHSEGPIKRVLFHGDTDKIFDWGTELQQAVEHGLAIGIKPEQLDWNEQYEATTDDGVLVNSGEFTGLTSEDARHKMTAWLEQQGLGTKKVNYKMRDWVFSRQRYWGEPIPVVHCEHCGAVPLPESELPLRLPDVASYEPTDTGESPLANIEDWVNTTCPKCGGPAKRETNTMPQWAGSCWYYLRYIDPKNDNALVDKDKEKAWMPVDLYVGGAEHATRHLLYARFWHKFLYDLGVVSTLEPFKRLINVGLIQAEDGRKMSKRWGNVVNPDDVIGEYGADAMRTYEMFMGPFTQAIAWSTQGVIGVRRFLDRIWKLQSRITKQESRIKENRKIDALLHQTIKKVKEDIENFRFNTAISQMMIYVNELEKEQTISKDHYQALVILLSPFAPHMAEELWQSLSNDGSIFKSSWPAYDESIANYRESVTIVIQINGKIRDQIEIAPDTAKNVVEETALKQEKIARALEGAAPKKIIHVPNKLINIVL